MARLTGMVVTCVAQCFVNIGVQRSRGKFLKRFHEGYLDVCDLNDELTSVVKKLMATSEKPDHRN